MQKRVAIFHGLVVILEADKLNLLHKHYGYECLKLGELQ